MLVRSFGVIAAAGVVCAAAIIPAVPAAASSGHVGIVVSTGSSTSTRCVTSGGSGLDVLKRGYANTEIGQQGPYAGFVLRINGVGKNPPDTTHYWSYWHSSGTGDWTYSSSGAGGTTPKAGTVDGWSYVNGKQSATRPPRITYASICGAAKPKPTHTARPTAKPTPKPTPKTHAPTRVAAHSASHSAAHSSTRSANTPTHHPTPASSAGATSPPSPVSPASTAGRAARASPTLSTLAAHTRSKGPGFPAWGTIIAVIVVVALGGAAWLRLRHRPE